MGKFNAKGHALLGLKAFEMLPDWEKALYKPDMSEKALKKPWMPPGVTTVAEKAGCYCLILDWVYSEELFSYTRFPDGKWIPHGPPDDNYRCSVQSGKPPSYNASVCLVKTMLTSMIEAIRSNDWEKAVCHGGAMGHYLQEPFTPSHSVPNNLFHELFPDPAPQRHIFLHGAFDMASGNFAPLPVRLMGTSVNEAAYRIQIEIEKGILEAKKLVSEVIQSVYDGQPDAVRYEILSKQSQAASHLTACAWHTAISIALDRFDDEGVRALQYIDLTEVPPYFWHSNINYAHIEPGCIVLNNIKTPILMSLNDGEAKEVRRGFGMWGHSGVKFHVDGNSYSRFRCMVGLPANAPCPEKLNTVFRIETDKSVNEIYSEEIEYDGKCLLSFPLVPGKIKHIDIDISGAQSLILSAKTYPEKNPETGEIKYRIPHVAVCHPLLVKTGC